jgi:hypothetical protein
MCRCFKLFTQIGLLDIHDVVESQMSFIESVIRARELNGPNSILLKNFLRVLFFHTASAMRFKEAVSLPTWLPYPAPVMWTMSSLPGRQAVHRWLVPHRTLSREERF